MSERLGFIEVNRDQYDDMRRRVSEYSRLLFWLRDHFINIKSGIEEEGDRTYFGSTNDADMFREIVEKLDDVKWQQIIADAKP